MTCVKSYNWRLGSSEMSWAAADLPGQTPLKQNLHQIQIRGGLLFLSGHDDLETRLEENSSRLDPGHSPSFSSTPMNMQDL